MIAPTKEGWKAIVITLASLTAMVISSMLIGWVMENSFEDHDTGAAFSILLGVPLGVGISFSGMLVYYSWTDR